MSNHAPQTIETPTDATTGSGTATRSGPTTGSDTEPRPHAGADKLPLAALLALTTAVFVTSLTETLPAGVLPSMSSDLGVGESAMGQSVTIYAIGTALTAIPLFRATSGLRRKRLLLATMAGFAAANTVTAVSTNYPLTMAARFVAGVAAGLAWALLAGYARRMAPVHLQGKAIAVVMAGIPVALSLGVPAGTFLGKALGWRVAFALMTVLAVGVIGWILALVPDHPGQRLHGRTPVLRTLRIPGVTPVLFVTLVFVSAHTVLYTYIAAFLDEVGMRNSTDLVLLVFGAASMASIWIVGAHIHRRLRALTVVSTLLFAAAAGLLAIPTESPVLILAAAALWGLGWGGIPTLLQTAAGDAGGDDADTAQAMLVTLWNVAMAGGAVAGGILLDVFGTGSFAWTVIALLIPVLVVVVAARAHGFPAERVSGDA
ncbi:MFS transporter [Streptomyces sp. SID3343]|uniref:MFS transporter n=1 Tax=Streptomyces sp. SID3343 TaxID=2690260 RepID=UPI00136B01FB|nr:MFS transporter [Streptomyces sp. SID3343]MYW06193.1 MFS transporter [Streptomyces sp. SID3343]